jgi:predicted permease
VRRLIELWNRIFHLRQRSEFDRGLAEEIDHHVELKTEANRRAGMSADEARYAAKREFGNVTLANEDSRAAWSFRWIEDFARDLGHAARMWTKSPGFALAAVLSLALGIGANTAIFSAIDTLMLRMLPVRSPQELFKFSTENTSLSDLAGWPYGWYERWHDRVSTFSGLTASSLIDRFNVLFSGPGGTSNVSSLKVGLVAGNYFQTLGVNPAIGRTLTPDDDRAQGANPVAVISYGFWERHFGRAGDVVGRTFTFNGTSYVIIGAAAAGFSGDVVGHPADLWIPLAMQTQVMPERPNLLSTDWRTGWGWLRIVGRLKPGTTIQQSSADANLVYQQFQRERADELGYPFSPSNVRRVELLPAAKGYSLDRATFAQPLEILMIVVGLVLLIACANIANLMLVRSAARQREMAVRLAIGASRGRLIRQMLTESVLLAMMSGVLGLIFAQWGTAILLRMVDSGLQPISLDLHPDGRVLGFTMVLCLFTGVLFGLVPALRASGTAISSALNGSVRSESAFSAGGWARFRSGRLLVVTQIALSLILIFVAGLFTLTLSNLKKQELGIDREKVLMIWAGPSQSGQTGSAVVGLHRTILERVSALPGVVSASESLYGLLNGSERTNPSEDLSVDGQPSRPGQQPWVTLMVGPRFFETLGIPLVAGRDFSAADTTATSPAVAIVNETMAHSYFGSGNAIGRHFLENCRRCVITEIVGIVKDAKYAGPRQQNLAIAYLAYRQSDVRASSPMFVAVRTIGNPAGLAMAIREELRQIDPGLPVLGINTVEQQVNDLLVEERLIASLSGFFGSFAVLLACLGLYGIISYTVALRTNEIGVRIALGATGADVARMVLKESMVLVIAGVAIGMPVALASARVISNRLFGIGTADPVMISGAAALMIAVAVVASLVPARRAARVDPMVALRCE